MTRPSDEILMAYADGELSSDEAARVAAIIDGDAEARAIVASYRATRSLAAAAMSEPGESARLAEIARSLLADTTTPGGSTRTAGASSDTIVPLRRPARTSGARPARSFGPYAALAASLVALVGGMVGYQLLTDQRPGAPAAPIIALGPVDPASPLAAVLEQRASGEAQALPPQAGAQRALELVAVTTFRDKSDRPCREFEAVTADADQRVLAIGVACRRSQGSWTVEGAVHLAASQATQSDRIEPASGIAESDAIPALMRLLGASAALSAEDEKALLARGWR
ncbi:MAG: hypothetical protein NW205_09425 [Hyphomicrobiaceae bacterium]|nr:hypothetical protein [Hyphomicrobiaceae bacterium]